MLSFFLERAVNEKHEGIPRNQITNPGEFKQGTGDLGGRISFGWDGWSPLAWRNTWDTCWSHNKREQLCRHLFKSSVVHEDGKHFPSLPPHVFMPANMLSWRIVHIRGHLVKTSSKLPKTSNSFQSMAPSKFLSADVTRDWRIILGWMLEGHLGYRNHRPWKNVDNGCEKLSEGFDQLRRFSQSSKTPNNLLQAYLLAAWLANGKKLENAKNCPL